MALYNSWIEQLYHHFVDFYYWEPQRLKGKSFNEVVERIKSLEVTLNGIFNITLSLLPSSQVEKILRSFSEDISEPIGNQISIVDFVTQDKILNNFCQPDVMLETENARIFIELKVNASLRLEQVQKYVL